MSTGHPGAPPTPGYYWIKRFNQEKPVPMQWDGGGAETIEWHDRIFSVPTAPDLSETPTPRPWGCGATSGSAEFPRYHTTVGEVCAKDSNSTGQIGNPNRFRADMRILFRGANCYDQALALRDYVLTVLCDPSAIPGHRAKLIDLITAFNRADNPRCP